MHVSTQVLHKTPQAHIQLVHAGAYEAPKSLHFPPHSHQIWEIIYYRSGHIECPVGNEKYESQPGMVLLTPPGVVHAEYAWTAYTNFYIQIDAPSDNPWPRMTLDDSERTLYHVCRSIVYEHGQRNTGREQMLASLTTQLDLLLRRSQVHEQLPETEQLVRKVEQILAERFVGEVVIKEIARDVGVSPSHLRAQFVRLRGYTPMEHLQSLRAQRAMALLRNSDLTLEVIAGLCGYDSASHLSRQVKRVVGQRPGALRGR